MDFNTGDLVLRRVYVGVRNARDGKLVAKWEGRYRVTAELEQTPISGNPELSRICLVVSSYDGHSG